MKYLVTLGLIAFSAVSSAGEAHNCDDLEGWWQGDRFEFEVGENVSETSVFLSNGHFYVQFVLDDGVNKRTQYESGRWQCDGDKLIMVTTSVDRQALLNIAIYDIVELNTAYIKVALESTDCSMVYGQCEGAVYEAIKVPDPEPHGCC